MNIQQQTNRTEPTLSIVDPLVYPDWDNLILDLPGGSFFHTSSWARVLHDTYGYRPCYVTSINNGKLDVLVPIMEIKSLLTGKRGVSLPFTDYCDPIVNDISIWTIVMEFLKEYGRSRKWKYLEFRGGEERFDQIQFSSFYYCHVLNLQTDVLALYSQLKSNTKRNIKKALREGVTITRCHTVDAVKIFYHMHCLTRKKHGVPPQPFSFFQRIYDHIICKDRGNIFFAEHQGKAIATAIYFNFGNEAIYKFGASDTAYLHLRPNDLLMWEAIQWYSCNGYTKFNFGRTDLGNDGLRQFKKGWGAEEEEIKYFKYDFVKNEFRSEKSSPSTLATSLIQFLPIFLSKLAGHVLYRHVG